MEIILTQAEKIKISNSEEIYQIMLKILEREEGLGFRQEHFWVIGLALDHMLLFVELVSLGTHNRFLVEPIEVFHTAVNKNARYLILVHNHPGGTLTPSEADEDLTNQLMHAAELVRLRVIEHLIITKEDFYSFSMSGVLDELEHSKKYAVYFIEEEKIEKRGIEIGREEGLKEGINIGKEEIAKNAINKGIAIDLIVQLTGLSMEEIEQLQQTSFLNKDI